MTVARRPRRPRRDDPLRRAQGGRRPRPRRSRPASSSALIGPNGAGKTTVFNLLTGVYAPTEGEIRVERREHRRRCKPYDDHELGVARTFQNIRLFGDLLGARQRAGSAATSSTSTRGRDVGAAAHATFREHEEQAESGGARAARASSTSTHRARDAGESLPYGDQRRLEIARALATRPKLLLLDEPAAGMNPQESDGADAADPARSATRFGIAILLIEHDMELVMGICERIIVLDYGVTIAEGMPEEIQKRPAGHRGLPRRATAEAGRWPSRALDRNLDVALRRDPRAARRFVSTSTQGEIVTLIGANGAGKTTTLRAIWGCVEPRDGRHASSSGESIRGTADARVVARWGSPTSPEGAGSSRTSRSHENLELGAYLPQAAQDRGERARARSSRSSRA